MSAVDQEHDVAARRPGRPRSTDVDASILRAATELFVELGYDGLGVEAVAARAGVSKTAIYRRYPGKADLVIAAAEQLCASAKGPAPDTGALRSDLLALAHGYRRMLVETEVGRCIPVLVVARDRDPELAAAHRAFIDARRAEACAVVERARARGELGPGVDTALVVDLVSGPLFHQVVICGRTVDDAYLERLVDLVLTGCT